jgi:hypothetical protein
MRVAPAESQPRGLAVTIARKGKIQRSQMPTPHVEEDEEDEDDAPTTLMPHGSALSEAFRRSIEEERARIIEEDKEARGQVQPVEEPPKPRTQSVPKTAIPNIRAAARAEAEKSSKRTRKTYMLTAAGTLLLSALVYALFHLLASRL